MQKRKMERCMWVCVLCVAVHCIRVLEQWKNNREWMEENRAARGEEMAQNDWRNCWQNVCCLVPSN